MQRKTTSTVSGSNVFLETLNRRGHPTSDDGMSEVVALLSELRSGPRPTDELAKRLPFGEKIIHQLISDGMIETCEIEGEKGVQLTPSGKEFLMRAT